MNVSPAVNVVTKAGQVKRRSTLPVGRLVKAGDDKRIGHVNPSAVSSIGNGSKIATIATVVCSTLERCRLGKTSGMVGICVE